MSISISLRLPKDLAKTIYNADFIQQLDDGQRFGQDYFTGRSSLVLVRNKNSSEVDIQSKRASLLTFGFDVFYPYIDQIPLSIDNIEELWLSASPSFTAGQSIQYVNLASHDPNNLNRIVVNRSDFGAGPITPTVTYIPVNSSYEYQGGEGDLMGLYDIVNWPFSGEGGVARVYIKAKIKTLLVPPPLPAYPELFYGIPAISQWYPNKEAYDTIVWLNDPPSRPTLPIARQTYVMNNSGITTEWVGRKTMWEFEASEEDTVAVNSSAISRYVSDIVEVRPDSYGYYLKVAKPVSLTGRYTNLLPRLYDSAGAWPSGEAYAITRTEERVYYSSTREFDLAITALGILPYAYGIGTVGVSLNHPFIGGFTTTLPTAPDFAVQTYFQPQLQRMDDTCTVRLMAINGLGATGVPELGFGNTSEVVAIELAFNEISNPIATLRHAGFGTTQIVELPMDAVPAILSGGIMELYISPKPIENIMLSEAYFTPIGWGDTVSPYYHKSYLLASSIHPMFSNYFNGLYMGSAVAAWTNNGVSTSGIIFKELTSGIGRFLLNADMGDCRSDDNVEYGFSVVSSPHTTWDKEIGLLGSWFIQADLTEPTYSYNFDNSITLQAIKGNGVNSTRHTVVEIHSTKPSFSNRTKVMVNLTDSALSGGFTGEFYIALSPVPSLPSNNAETQSGIGTTYKTMGSRCEPSWVIDTPQALPTVMVSYSYTKKKTSVIQRHVNGTLTIEDIDNSSDISSLQVELNGMIADKESEFLNNAILTINNTNVGITTIPLSLYMPSNDNGMGYYVAVGSRADVDGDFNDNTIGQDGFWKISTVKIEGLQREDANVSINPLERFYGKYTRGNVNNKCLLGQQLLSSKTNLVDYSMVSVGSSYTQYAFRVPVDSISDFIYTISPKLFEIKMISTMISTPYPNNLGIASVSVPKMRFYGINSENGYPDKPLLYPNGVWISANDAVSSTLREKSGDLLPYNDLVQFDMSSSGFVAGAGGTNVVWAVVEIPPSCEMATAYTDLPFKDIVGTGISMTANYISNSTFENGTTDGWYSTSGASIGVGTTIALQGSYSMYIMTDGATATAWDYGAGTGTAATSAFTIDVTDTSCVLNFEYLYGYGNSCLPGFMDIDIRDGSNNSVTILNKTDDIARKIVRGEILTSAVDTYTINFVLTTFGAAALANPNATFTFIVDNITVGTSVRAVNNAWYKMFATSIPRHDNVLNRSFLQTRTRSDSHAPLNINTYIDYDKYQRYYSQPTPLTNDVRIDIIPPLGLTDTKPQLAVVPPYAGIGFTVYIGADDSDSGIYAFRFAKEVKQHQLYFEPWKSWDAYNPSAGIVTYSLNLPVRGSGGYYQAIGPRKSWIQMIDRVGNVSESYVIQLTQPAFAVVDTKPPYGNVYFTGVATGAVVTRTNQNKVVFALDAYDEATAVKDYRWRNIGSSAWQEWRDIDSYQQYFLGTSSMRKRVEVQFRDYANNISTTATQYDMLFDGLIKNVTFNESVEYNGSLYISGVKSKIYNNMSLAESGDVNYPPQIAYYIYDPNTGQRLHLRQSDVVLLEVQPSGIGTYYPFTQWTPIDPSNPSYGAPVNSFYIDGVRGYVGFTTQRSISDAFRVMIVERNVAVIYKWDGDAFTKVGDMTYQDEKIITSMVVASNTMLLSTGSGKIYPFDGRVIYDAMIQITGSGGLPITKMLPFQFESENELYLYVSTATKPTVWRIPYSGINANTGWENLTTIHSFISTTSPQVTRIVDMVGAYDQLFFATDSDTIFRYNRDSNGETIQKSILKTSYINEEESQNIDMSVLTLADKQVLLGLKNRPEVYSYYKTITPNPEFEGAYNIIRFDNQFVESPYPWQYYNSNGYTNPFGTTSLSVESLGTNGLPKYYMHVLGDVGGIVSLTLDNANDFFGYISPTWTMDLYVEYIGDTTAKTLDGGRQSMQVWDGRYNFDLTYSTTALRLQSGDNIIEVPYRNLSGVVKVWDFHTSGGYTPDTQGWVIDQNISSMSVSVNNRLTCSVNGTNPRIKWVATSSANTFDITPNTRIQIVVGGLIDPNLQLRVYVSNSYTTDWVGYTYVYEAIPDSNMNLYTLQPNVTGNVKAMAIEISGVESASGTMSIDYIAFVNNQSSNDNILLGMTPVRVCVNNTDIKVYMGQNNNPLIDANNFLKMPTSQKKIKIGKLYNYKYELDSDAPLTVGGQPNYEPASEWAYEKIMYKNGVNDLPSTVEESDFDVSWKFSGGSGVSKFVNHLGATWALTSGKYLTKPVGMSTSPGIMNYEAYPDMATKFYSYSPVSEVWMEQTPNFNESVNRFVINPLMVASYQSNLLISGQYINVEKNTDTV